MTDKDEPLEQTRAFDPFPDGADPLEDQATQRMDRQPAGPADATQRMAPMAAGDTGPMTETIARREQRSLAGWLIALIILVALGIGVLLGYQSSEGGQEGVQTRKLVGPKGGVLDFADGKGKLEIPAGALPTATVITVRKVTNENRLRLGPESDPASVVYEPGELDMYVFEPVDLNLQVPATITLPRPADGSALLVDTPDGPRVVGAEAQGPVVTFETSTFSLDDR